MGLYLGGLIIGRIFASEIMGRGGAYVREDVFSKGLIIGILRFFKYSAEGVLLL